jgi:hypothetical protein
MKLEEALGITREGILLAKLNTPVNNKPENPLFFPRKKLKMTKVYSGNWTPKAWFIRERLEERATYLSQPTQISHEGLTSGFRSAIIKNPDNTYTKLKGVSLKPTIIEKTDSKNPLIKNTIHAKGLCGIGDSYFELDAMNVLNCVNELLVPAYPSFMEVYRFYKETPSIENFIKKFNQAPLRINYSRIRQNEFKKLGKEIKRIESEILKFCQEKEEYVVSAIKILGDTRLDETCYHLTKKELKPTLAKKRNEILKYLFFRAGVTNGMLTSTGFSWSSDMVYSNAHLGNFVVFSRKGTLDTGICDLGGAKNVFEFGNNYNFFEFAKQEVEDFKYEFERTSGLTIQKSYRHFPKQLKQDCFDMFRTGYGIIQLSDKKLTQDLIMGYQPPKTLVPKQAVISTEEFKNFLTEIKVV